MFDIKARYVSGIQIVVLAVMSFFTQAVNADWKVDNLLVTFFAYNAFYLGKSIIKLPNSISSNWANL